MRLPQTAATSLIASTVLLAVASTASGQSGSETFTATANVKTASGASASAPVTIVVDRKMPQGEADKLAEAFKSGGPAAFRKALVGVPPTGSVRVGNAEPVQSRLTIERTTDKGRLLTIVSDKPLLFLGAGLPGAKPKTGYDFSIVDIEADAQGNGSGTLAPAAKITVKGGAFVVDDDASELVKLTNVKRK